MKGSLYRFEQLLKTWNGEGKVIRSNIIIRSTITRQVMTSQ